MALTETGRRQGSTAGGQRAGANGAGAARRADEPPPHGDEDAPPDASVINSELEWAKEFVAEHGQDLLHVWAWSRWFAWDGLRWSDQQQDEVRRRAKATARARTIRALDGNAESFRLARAGESNRALEATLRLAASERQVAVDPDGFDRDPYLLNALNGTVDLRRGELRPHARADRITKLVKVTYDAKASCPRWDRFVEEVHPDPEVRAFCQRFVGYVLTGDISEQVLAFFWGAGENGKSTYVGALANIVGDYFVRAPAELLMTKRGDSHPTELALLFGKRLAACAEIEEGRALAEVRTKELTGGDQVACRRMREDFWSFSPTAKFIVMTNHRPVVRGTDPAIWRRIRLVPFTESFPLDRRDVELGDKLRREAPGILAWAVRGCLAWQEQGLGEPEAVRAATAAYRSSMDIVGRFIDEQCVVDKAAQVKKGALYTKFARWAEAAGESVISQRAFGERLVERGFSDDREGKNRDRIWRGIGLPPPPKEGEN